MEAQCASSSRSDTRTRARSGSARSPSPRKRNSATGRSAATATRRIRRPKTDIRFDALAPFRNLGKSIWRAHFRRVDLAVTAADSDRASEKRMTFFEHIEELRQRLKIVVIVVLILFALNLTTAIGSVRLGSMQVPMLVPALGTNNANIATQFFVGMENYLVPDRVNGIPVNRSFSPPWDAYVVMFKVAFFLAAVTASPIISYQIGQFIGPALKPSEKRLIIRITLPVAVLFLSGVTLCLVVVLPVTFGLLYSVQNVLAANFLILYGGDFIDFVLLFSVAFGLAFQLPVLMYGLSWLGIVNSGFWKKYWRIAAIAIFLFGAIITPDGSGITMMLVSIPMLFSYVLGYVVAVRIEKRRGRAKTS